MVARTGSTESAAVRHKYRALSNKLEFCTPTAAMAHLDAQKSLTKHFARGFLEAEATHDLEPASTHGQSCTIRSPIDPNRNFKFVAR